VKFTEPKFESYFGAVLIACGVTWLWDFAGQMALNLTIISSFVYLEAGFIGAFILARKLPKDHVLIGLRAGFGTFLVNLAFRLILFELAEALGGVVIYFISFTIGGMLGRLLAKRFTLVSKTLSNLRD